MSDTYGASDRPVPHDPLSAIVNISFPGRADVIIIRSGRNLPDGVLESGRNVVFSPGAPAKDTERDSQEQMDAHLDQFYVGAFTDATNVNPSPPLGQKFYDTPYRADGLNNVTFGIGELRTPSTTEWGDRSNNYNGDGMYLWHTGRLGTNVHQGGVQCCLINARKMLWDFRELGNKSLPPGSDGYRDTLPSNMSATVFYQGTFPVGGSDNLMCEFAAYRFTSNETSGDFFLVTNGAAYGNALKKIARKVIVVDTSVLLPSVNWSYNFKKQIGVSGALRTLADAEMGPFELQPGG